MYVVLPVIYPFSCIFKMFKYSCLVQKVVQIHVMSVYVLLFVSTYIYYSVIYHFVYVFVFFFQSVILKCFCVLLTEKQNKRR